MAFELLALGIVFVVAGILVSILLPRRSKHKLGIIEQVETSLSADVRGGQYVELKGEVECERPLTTPAGKIQCAYYEFVKERERAVADEEGETTVKRDVVTSERRSVPFYLRDSSGRILIEPEKASIEAMDTYSRYIPATRPRESLASKALELAGDVAKDVIFDERRRKPESAFLGTSVKERAVKIGQPVYVLGEVKKIEKELVVTKPGGGPFIITCKSEEEMTKAIRKDILMARIGGIVFIAAGTLMVAGAFLLE